MEELYNLTMAEATSGLIESIMMEHNVTKAMATKLLKNALIYNCVADEILGQVDFLLHGSQVDAED